MKSRNCWLMMWEWWSGNSHHTAGRYPHLKARPFAGTLPSTTPSGEVERVLKAIMVSHSEMSPITKAEEYGKRVEYHDPNPPGMPFESPDLKPRSPIHRPPVRRDRQESYVCRIAGPHGLTLRATKVTNLHTRKTKEGFEMKWVEPLGKTVTIQLPPEEESPPHQSVAPPPHRTLAPIALIRSFIRLISPAFD